MTPPENIPMRSMQVMTSDIRYTGVTYAPFTAALPSEQSAASESSSGRPTGSIRRGKILGPDTPPANESPIGEPWILAVFAILFTLTIIRNKEKHNIITGPSRDHLPRKTQYRTFQNLKLQYQMTKNNSTMKNKPSIQSVQNKLKVGIKSVVNATKVLIPILIFAFLTLGFGQAWGAITFSGGYVYFDNTNTNWSNVIELVAHQYDYKDYIGATTMSKISGTNNLYYCSNPQGSNWGNIWGWRLMCNSSAWGNSDNSDNSVKNYATNYTATTDYGLNSGSYYLCYGASSSKGCALTTSYLGNSNSYTALNYTQTLNQYVSTDGDSTYSASTAKIGTISIATKYLSGASTTANHNASIATGYSSTNTTAARTATVTMTIADVADGYSFQGWYSAASGGTKLGSADTYTYQASAATSVYARFIKEATYDITVANSVNATTSTVKVGSSAIVISAPEIAGYSFSNWSTMPSGVTITSGSVSTATISITATKAATIRANYTEDRTSRWHLVGQNDIGYEIFPDGWAVSSTSMMQKASGHTTEDIVYYSVDVATAGGRTYVFKIVDDNGTGDDIWYGYSTGDTYLEWTNTSTQNVYSGSGNSNNLKFTPTIVGTYEFKVDYSGTYPAVTITYPEVYAISGSFNSWTESNNLAFSGNDGSYSVSIDGSATNYQFKVLDNGSWYGHTNKTFTGTESNVTLSTPNNNINLKADVYPSGSYTFAYNKSTKKLGVTYPTSYIVNYAVGATKGQSTAPWANFTGALGDKDIASGTKIAGGTTIHLYAANAKEHYTFYGWYTEENPDRDDFSKRVSTLQHYSTSVTTTKSYYAIYFEDPYWVNTYVNGLGTITPAEGQNAYIATPSGNFTAEPGIGYKFDSWEQRSGALTIKSPTNATTNVNATAASELQANFSPRYAVRVKTVGGDWSLESVNHLTGYTTVSSKDVGYSTITLAANTNYEIKVYDRQTNTWYGGSEDQNIAYGSSGSGNEYIIATTYSGHSVYVQTAAAGDYTFNWNLTDKKIAVVYPTSWFITSGQKTEGQSDNAGGSFTAVDDSSNDVKGGKFVADNASVTFTATPNTGYTFDGWYTNEACTEGKTTTNPMKVSSITANKTIYAKFLPKTYSVTLTREGEGYGSGGDASVTATFNAALPSATMPTAANGWAFMGYYSAADGEGRQFINPSGAWVTSAGDTISGGKWVKPEGIALYAYFKQAEITAITLNSSVLDPVDAGGTGWVIANPTVEPTPVLPVKICWELLYDNDNPVPAGHEPQAYAEEGKPNQVRFSIAGLAASRYKIKATLRTGSSCDGGDELSTHTQTFTIASSFTVNILYQDGDNNNIAPGTTSPGKATDWTTISAPDIFGYTFDGWNLGEGITTADPTDKQNDFRFKASYYGTIVAQYTKNQYIYLDLSQAFSASDKWNNPYVYFYNGDPWVDNKGAGAKDGDKTHTHYISGHAMTKIDGTDIWYFDYGGVSGATSYVAFTWGDKTMQENFWGTDVIFRGDFSESTPLFVPATDGTAESRKDEVNDAQYYNKGYWVTYLGEATGYTLLVYNSAGDVELKREPFIAADKRMTMTSTVQLDASSNYKLEVLRNDGYWYKAASNFTASSLGPKAIETGGSKYNIQTNADGIYTFTLGYNSGNLQLSVVYPSGIGDFRIAYTDNATWSHSHTLNSWILPSKTLAHRANGVDTVSFFISKGAGITPKIRWEKVTAVSESSVTWGTTGEWLTTGYTDVSEAGVYNFKVTQNADGTSIASIERIGEYDGSYYIRCNALRSKWDHYTIDSDHRMTYSEFSESAANSFGEKYSHYKAKWCPRNTNIAFVIANDYSPCLTDKLTQDVGGPEFNNLEANGTLKYEKTGEAMKYDDANAYLDKYSANVRFMWNRKTNKISRAYVSSATSNNAKFLVLQGSGTTNSNIYNGTTGLPFTANTPGANSVILKDDQNWIYEEVIKANPSALVKLYANYCGQTQWFRGADGTPFTKDDNAIELLGGSSSSSQYAVRVIYDFKTNRLVCAWIPEGASQEIETNLTVNADVMVIREHQGPAQCITFANDKSMTGVKTVYGAMKFNRWILSNRAHPEDTNPNHCRESDLGNDLADFHPVLPIGQQLSIYERSLYFISFPFDVKASEIFGFGHYWDEWYLEYYDGKTRAKNGYWIDSPPNWKYVTPDMLEDFTLKANEGYILGLDLDFMQVDNTAFWSNGISTVELYFPSTVNLETLKQTNVTIPALSSDYKCTINRGTPEGDRRVKDSYWRCLGVPSFNIYNSALKDGSGKTIEWKTDYTWHADESEFPFIYMWNKADNTLTAQSTSAFNFLPMHAYLVQNGGEINWTAVSAKPSSIVARQESAIMPNEYNWRITLSRDSVTEDQTYVRMTNLEQVTDSFDFGQDLVKELNTGRSDIYTFIGYERVAANSRPIETTQTTIVPMGLNIETTGDYTFSIPEGTDGVGVVLVDEATGIRTSLGALDYTVTLQQGDYTNRFYLEISPIQNTPTGLEEPTSNSSLKGRAQKRIIDGVLYIVRDGKIFDARGARVE